MIFEQSLAAIDPVQLAIDSGQSKFFPSFRTINPIVIRPHLLTDQLKGCDCGMRGMIPPDYGTLRGGLGLTLDPNTFDMNALQVPSAGTGNVSVLQTMAVGSNFIPGVGQIASVALTTFNQFLNQFQAWFHIGAGRREADIIVPTQNNMMNALGGITDQIRTGQNPDLATLMSLYRQVWMMGVAFIEFVLQRQFTDRRASGQALNTVMPYIDGTCGYAVPIGFTANPAQTGGCLSWGDGTVGSVGTNGMLGAIARAIQAQGGALQNLPNLEGAANQGIRLSSIPVTGGLPPTIMGISTPLALLGMAALFAYKKGLFGRG